MERGFEELWQSLLYRRVLNTIALPLKTRHFKTELQQVDFKLKKLKQFLFQKRAIFHLPSVKVGRAI